MTVSKQKQDPATRKCHVPGYRSNIGLQLTAYSVRCAPLRQQLSPAFVLRWQRRTRRYLAGRQ